MKIKIFEFNPLAVNTYVVSDETHECVIIDAACFDTTEKEALRHYIAEEELVVKHFINTHLHFDHVFGAKYIASQFQVPMQAHRDDEFLLNGLPAQLQMFGFPPTEDFTPTVGKYIDEPDTVTFGNQKLQVLHVPGHSPGSIAFYSAENRCVFVGDVLFHSSIGRTDLAGGNHAQLIDSIRKKLFTLPDNTAVYPGHGTSTTVAYEKRYNPFF